MKIYLIEKDNGESYEDYHAYIESAFTSYRTATEALLNEGYKMYPQRSFYTTEWKWELGFELKVLENQLEPDEIEELRKEHEKAGFYDENYEDYGYEMVYGARIIEIELQE